MARLSNSLDIEPQNKIDDELYETFQSFKEAVEKKAGLVFSYFEPLSFQKSHSYYNIAY
jgi:hypothetical protein